MKENSTRNMERRNFFKRISFGFIGVTIISSLPTKIFAKANRARKKVNVNIHSSAIKRTR